MSSMVTWTREYLSVRKVIEKERRRLLETPDKPDFDEWLGDREYPLDWMKLTFGETLVEVSAETIYINDRNSDFPEYLCSHSIYCVFCNKIFSLDETFIYLFCDSDDYDERGSLQFCEVCKEGWL